MDAIERHPAMLHHNYKNWCLPCQNSTAQNPQTHQRCKEMDGPLTDQHRLPTPEPTLSSPGTPPAPPGDHEAAQSSQIDHLSPGYVYSHAPLPSTQFFNLDVYAQDSQPDTDYYPDTLSVEGTSTGQYTICGVVMQLAFILQTRAVYWANLAVRTSIVWKEWDVWFYYYLQLADTVKYILKDIFICIIKEQCSDQGEYQWKWEKGCQNIVNDVICQINRVHIEDTPGAKWVSMECIDSKCLKLGD